MEHFEFKHKTYFKNKYLYSLIKEGSIKMTLADKPTSKNQKYYTVEQIDSNDAEQ